MKCLGLAAAIFSLCLNLACRKHQDEESSVETGNSEAAALPKSEAKPPEPEKIAAKTSSKPVEKIPKPSCDALNIPSYTLWIKDLAELRCVSCHNENFAWNAVILTSYLGFKDNAIKAKSRIANNALTKPLDPIEASIFLKWFANGMPENEEDCASDTPNKSDQ